MNSTHPGTARNAHNRVTRFILLADEPRILADFYARVFGWTFEDWSEYSAVPCLGVRTGSGTSGVDGVLIPRHDLFKTQSEPEDAIDFSHLMIAVESIQETMRIAIRNGAVPDGDLVDVEPFPRGQRLRDPDGNGLILVEGADL